VKMHIWLKDFDWKKLIDKNIISPLKANVIL